MSSLALHMVYAWYSMCSVSNNKAETILYYRQYYIPYTIFETLIRIGVWERKSVVYCEEISHMTYICICTIFELSATIMDCMGSINALSL